MKGFFLATVVVIVIAAAFIMNRGDSPAPAPVPAEEVAEPLVVKEVPAMKENARAFHVGGQVGEVDQSAIEGLSMSVPGVQKAQLDINSRTLTLEVAIPVFQVSALADTLERPGLGWTITSVKGE